MLVRTHMHPLAVLAAACTPPPVVPRLDAANTHMLLGKRAVLLAGALPWQIESTLSLADAALSAGASVNLLVPLPHSEAEDDAALRLMQRILRRGWPELMEALGFSCGVGQSRVEFGPGNRQRLDVQHVLSNDVEACAPTLRLSKRTCSVHVTPAVSLAPTHSPLSAPRHAPRPLGDSSRRRCDLRCGEAQHARGPARGYGCVRLGMLCDEQLYSGGKRRAQPLTAGRGSVYRSAGASGEVCSEKQQGAHGGATLVG